MGVEKVWKKVGKDESSWHKKGSSPVQVVVEEAEQAQHNGRPWVKGGSWPYLTDFYNEGSSGVRSIESAVIGKWGNNEIRPNTNLTLTIHMFRPHL